MSMSRITSRLFQSFEWTSGGGGPPRPARAPVGAGAAGFEASAFSSATVGAGSANPGTFADPLVETPTAIRENWAVARSSFLRLTSLPSGPTVSSYDSKSPSDSDTYTPNNPPSL